MISSNFVGICTGRSAVLLALEDAVDIPCRQAKPSYGMSAKGQLRGLSCDRSRCFESRSALCRPIIGWPVEFCDCGNAIGQDHPRLLRGRVDVNVRLNAGGFVERSHPYKMNARTGLRIVAPHRHATIATAPEVLTFAAGTGQRCLSWFAFRELDLRRLDQGIDCESRSGLALAPCAMAAMHK